MSALLNRQLIRLLIAVLVLTLGQAGRAQAPQDPAPSEDPDVKLGRESAAEHDKTVKFVTDPATVERVERIGREIAGIANEVTVPILWGLSSKKQFEYRFRVVEDKDVNAYSMPGGFIYVNSGLLAFAKSDDELAGVLAHEVVHAAHRHMMKLIAEQEKMQLAALGPALISVLLGKGGTDTTSNLLLAGQLWMTAKLSGYGVEAEKDADNAAVHYLKRTKYNPVGLLTFMERLYRQERLKPEVELGIYRTHPPSVERAQALIRLLRELDIPINRRATDPSIAAGVFPTEKDGAQAFDVKMNGTVIVRLASSEGDAPAARAEALAKSVNALFDDGLVAFELGLSSDQTRVIARRRTLLAVTEADARASERSVQDVAKGMVEALRNLLWQDQFNKTPMPRT
ncbi:MAG: M48 family metalloprotease [Chthonomonadales bacterium]|nr:M48 family metalloprotease [Chthonomonadales bacterium]